MAKVPESAQELFNTQVPGALAAHPDKAKEIGAIYLFKITGDDGGTWTVDLASSPPTCTPGGTGPPHVRIRDPHDRRAGKGAVPGGRGEGVRRYAEEIPRRESLACPGGSDQGVYYGNRRPTRSRRRTRSLKHVGAHNHAGAATVGLCSRYQKVRQDTFG